MRTFAMNSYLQHYIDGKWIDSEGGRRHEVVNPATEEVVSEVTLGSQADGDKAVRAAGRRALDSFSQTSKADRAALLGRIIEEYKKRIPDIARAISEEMGAPITLSMTAQAAARLGHFDSSRAA